MSIRTAAWLAWSLAGLYVVMFLGSVALYALARAAQEAPSIDALGDLLILVTVALVMAAMMVAMAAPAFAYHAPGHVGLAAYDDRKEGAEYCRGVVTARPSVSDCTLGAGKAKGPK